MRNRSALRHAQGPYKGTIILRVQYAQDTIHPWPSRAVASNCLILIALKVSSFQMKNKSDTQRAFTPVLADTSMRFLETKKAWS